MDSLPYLILLILVQNSLAVYRSDEVDKHDALTLSYVHFGRKSILGRFELCGGVLISDRHVLTAAHCNISPAIHIAYLGSLYRHDRKISHRVRTKIEKVFTHSSYVDENQRLSGDADIAIVTLMESPDRGEKMAKLSIKPIDVYWGFSRLRLGTRLRIVGFAAHEIGVNKFAPSLRQGFSFSTDIDACMRKYRVNPSARNTICLDADGSKSCDGDSGGGLYVFDEGQWKVVGIMTGGYCRPSDVNYCSQGVSSGLNLEGYRKWIEAETTINDFR